MILHLLTRSVVIPGSYGFRRRPFRLRRQPPRNVSLIQSGHHRRQKFRADWFRAERGGVCFRAKRVRPRDLMVVILDRPRYVPSEKVGAIEEGTVHLTIDADEYGRLDAYKEPPQGERFLAP